MSSLLGVWLAVNLVASLAFAITPEEELASFKATLKPPSKLPFTLCSGLTTAQCNSDCVKANQPAGTQIEESTYQCMTSAYNELKNAPTKAAALQTCAKYGSTALSTCFTALQTHLFKTCQPKALIDALIVKLDACPKTGQACPDTVYVPVAKAGVFANGPNAMYKLKTPVPVAGPCEYIRPTAPSTMVLIAPASAIMAASTKPPACTATEKGFSCASVTECPATASFGPIQWASFGTNPPGPFPSNLTATGDRATLKYIRSNYAAGTAACIYDGLPNITIQGR